MSDKKSCDEIWAAVDEFGRVLWSRGGSSTARKLLVYPSKKKAEAVLNSPWIKQVIGPGEACVVRLYTAPTPNPGATGESETS